MLCYLIKCPEKIRLITRWVLLTDVYCIRLFLVAHKWKLFPDYKIQWNPLIVATPRPALSGHNNNRWLLYPAVL